MKYIFILLFIIISCDTKKPVSDSQIKTENKNPDNILWDYNTVVTEKEKRIYTLWSGRVEIYEFTKKTFCHDSLIVAFYDEMDQDAKNWVHANKGVWNQNTNDFQAIDNVVVINSQGHILKTDTLYYDKSREKIYSNSDVMFYNLTDTLYGTSFISNVNLSEINIKNATGVSSRD